MRLHFGPIPESPDFHPEQTGWRPLREPSAAVFSLLGGGVGLLTGAVAVPLWMLPQGDRNTIGITISTSDGQSAAVSAIAALAWLLGSLVLLVVVHEILHAVCFPGGLASRRTMIGVWPRIGVFYAHYDGPLSRNRMLVVLLMPLLVISGGLWLVEMLFPTGWGNALGAFSIVNAMFAGGDVLATGMIAWQVPANAEVRNQGWKTWWRVPTVDVEEPAAATNVIPTEAAQEA
jgi:hypothetical protein